MSETTASAKAAESDKPGPKNKRAGKKDISEPSFNMDEIRELADLVDEYGLTDFEFENENIRVRLSKTSATHVIQQSAPAPAPSNTVGTAQALVESGQAAPIAPPEEDLYKIT